MPRVYRTDRAEGATLRLDDLSPAKALPSGFLRGEAYCTRTGVFEYHLDDGTVRKELRHPDEVFDPESMESLRQVPITHGHPDEDVTTENVRDLACGWVGDSVDREDRFIKAPICLTDRAIIDDVVSGKAEVSCGYWCELIEEAGEYEGEPYTHRQTQIRYNHLAAGIDAGRAGPDVKIRTDSKAGSQEEDVHVKRRDSEPAPRRTRTVRLDADAWKKVGVLVPRMDMDLPDESAQMIEGALAAALDALNAAQGELSKLKGDMEAKDAEMEEAAAEAEKQIDAANARADEAEKQLKKLDEGELERRAEERHAVVHVAAQVLNKDAAAFKGVTLDDIRLQVITAVHKDEADELKGKSADYRRARYDAIVKSLDRAPLPPVSRGGGANRADAVDVDDDDLFLSALEDDSDDVELVLDADTAHMVRDAANAKRATRPLAFSKR